MPPTSNTKREWPNYQIYSLNRNGTFKLTGEPPVSFSARDGKSYVDMLRLTTHGNVGTTARGSGVQYEVSIARLWSTGLWGLVKNKDTEIYSAVKLFKVDLVNSQDSLESRVPYMFWNQFTPKPYGSTEGGYRWLFLTQDRSPYLYKTSTQLREWIESQKELDPGFIPGPEQPNYGSPTPAPPPVGTDLGVKYFDVRVNDYLTLQLPVSSHPWANANWHTNFDEVVRAALDKRGFTPATIANAEFGITAAVMKKLEALSLPGSNSTGIGGGRTGSSGRVSAPSSTPTTPIDYSNSEQTVVIRLPSGSQLVDIDAMSKLNQSTIKPHLRQAYTDASGERVEESFYFDYVPSTISYTLGGSSWNEIPRTLGEPLIEWQSYGLSRVQMTFLIAGQRSVNNGQGNSFVPDGLNIDIEDRIQLLRRIATRPSPIVVYGLDDIFNIQLQQSQTTGAPCAWAISDLGITAKRRTEGPPSLISVAQVNISLIELPVERSVAYKLNPLPLQTTTPAPGSTAGRTPIRPDLWTEYLSKPIESVLLIQT